MNTSKQSITMELTPHDKDRPGIKPMNGVVAHSFFQSLNQDSETGTVFVKRFYIEKEVDKHSPLFYQAATKKAIFKTVQILSKEEEKEMQYELSDACIYSIRLQKKQGGQAFELIGLSFKQMKVSYKDGKAQSDFELPAHHESGSGLEYT